MVRTYCKNHPTKKKVGAIELARTIQAMSRTTYLNVGRNRINNEGMIALSEALKNKKNLAELHVDENIFNDTAVIHLVKSLNYINRPKLRKFVLHTKTYDENTCLEIAIFIGQTGKRLEYIDISGVNITSKCAALLSLAYKKAVSISSLFMKDTHMDMKSLNIFTNTNFKTLSQLTVLDVSENFLVEKKGLLKFATSMMKYTKAKVNIMSFSLGNLFKIVFPNFFGYDALISSYLLKCTEDPDRDNSMCDELDDMIEMMEEELDKSKEL